jgi:transforming growth factor-beta-induced protein
MRKLGMLLVVPTVMMLAACSDDGPTAPMGPNLVQLAQSVNAETGEFSTLLAAVVRAGLVDALSATGQRTVFAPTDAAFAEAGLTSANIGTVPVETLTAILLYHVAPGRLLAADVVSVSQLTMANGGVAQIRLEGGVAYIDDARILATDVEATNGVIHVIDAVILP